MRASALLLLCASLGAAAHAATLRVTVDGERGAVDVLVGTRATTADAPRWLAERRLGAGERQATFEGVPAGIAVVLVRGAGPLERHAAQLRVPAVGNEQVDVTITPVVLRGRLTMDGAPLGGAIVDLERAGDLWDGSLTADERGRFATPLWQQGSFRAHVRGGGLRSTVPATVTLTGTKAIDWSFEVPPRTIRGRVVDESGTPVADAAVVLMQASDSARQTRRMNSAGDGSFEFRGVLRGTHWIRVVPGASLLHSPPVSVGIGERDVKSITIALLAGVTRELAIVDADGAPVASARVLCTTGADVRALATTDAHGHATLAMPKDEPSVLFAFPPGGSLAIRRVGPGDDTALRIAVPRGDASLEVKALATDGAALPGLHFLVRLDGELVPPEVIRASRREDLVLDTGDEGGSVTLQRIPPGHYELWPYRDDEEARAMIASSIPAQAPVALDVTPGANRVTLRFRRGDSEAALGKP